MNLNKHQQQQWVTLTTVFETLTAVGLDESLIRQQMNSKIMDFEEMLRGQGRVKMFFSPDPKLELVDCSRDSLKLTVDAVPSKTLRGRIEGILFSVNVTYKDSYAHSNASIADALEATAKKIRALPVELMDQESINLLEESMVMSEVESEGEESTLSTQGSLDKEESTSPESEDTTIVLVSCEDQEALN